MASLPASAALLRLLDLASAVAERAGAPSLTAEHVAEAARALAESLPERPHARRVRLDGDLLFALSAAARDAVARRADTVDAAAALREAGVTDDVAALALARLDESLRADPPPETEGRAMLLGLGPTP